MLLVTVRSAGEGQVGLPRYYSRDQNRPHAQPDVTFT